MTIKIINNSIYLIFTAGVLTSSFIGNNIEINSKHEGDTEIVKEDSIYVKLKTENKTVEIELEEYITGVVSAEMPLSFHKEALKAQAIAARTYTLKRILHGKELTNSTINQVYETDKQRKDRLGKDYEYYTNKLKSAISETKGIFLKYEEEVIDALYFSSSSGFTISAKDYYGNDVPYLKSVQSTEESNIYKQKTIKLGINQLEKLLNINSINKIVTTNNGLYNNIFSIDDKYTFSNIKIMKLLNLNSPIIEIYRENETIHITTYGHGHNVGMSQYGAHYKALNGMKYDEILKHYYFGVKLYKI